MHTRILLALCLLALCAPSCSKKSKSIQPVIDSNCTITQLIDVEDDSFTYRFEYTNGVLSGYGGSSMFHERSAWIQRSGDSITAYSYSSARSGGRPNYNYDTLHLDKDGFVLWKDSWSGQTTFSHTKVVYTYDSQHQLLKEVNYREHEDPDSIVYTWNNGDCIMESSSRGSGHIGHFSYYNNIPAYYGDPLIFQSWINNFGAYTLKNTHAAKGRYYSSTTYANSFTYQLQNGKLSTILDAGNPANIYSYNCQ